MPFVTEAKTFCRDMVAIARANFLPAFMLQIFVFLLLGAYHYWPAARDALNELAAIKTYCGFIFAFVASAFAGAVLPFTLQNLQRGEHRRITVAALPALVILWGIRGCIIDVFYHLQSILWGTGTDPGTLILKIVCDLGIANPLVFTPILVLIFSWVDTNGHAGQMRDNFRGGLLTWWRRETQPLLPVAWLIWTPALAVVYSLPLGLQFPVDALIQCFWSLALVVLTDKNQTAQMATEPA